MKLPTIDQIDENQKVVLRLDLDVPLLSGAIENDSRLVKSIPTVRMLLSKKCKLIIIGHLGRPNMDGEMADEKSRQELSLKPVYVELMSLLENGEDLISSVFVDEITNKELIFEAVENNQIVFLENLRFYKQENEANIEFLGHLAEIGNVFVNDALAVAHRKCASVMLFKMMKGFYGLGFAREVEKMAELLLKPKRPLVLVLGGAKKDKLDNLEALSKKADLILIGGKLPNYKTEFVNFNNVLWASLDETGRDISRESVDRFSSEIKMAGTVVLAGSMGRFEEEAHKQGNNSMIRSIVESQAIKVAAGGDTKVSLSMTGLETEFDYICSGGGVALEFLAKEGNLPAWEESFVSFDV